MENGSTDSFRARGSRRKRSCNNGEKEILSELVTIDEGTIDSSFDLEQIVIAPRDGKRTASVNRNRVGPSGAKTDSLPRITDYPELMESENQESSFQVQCVIGDYVLSRKIGEGSYGVVWEAYHSVTHAQVAIKAVGLRRDVFRARRLLREIRTLRFLNSHPHVIALVDVFVGDRTDTVYLVFEYATTDLYQIQSSSLYFSEEDVKRAMCQTLLGVLAIHRCGVIHRDLKPANILVTSQGSLKICDFGLARGISHLWESSTSPESKSHRRKLTMHVVTRWYRPPEVILLEDDYDVAVDIWSLGCILADLFTMMKENVEDPLKRYPLFPGNCCYPLTAGDEKEVKNDGETFDQLDVILNVIGTPSEEDVDALQNPASRDYLKCLPSKPAQDLRTLFPKTSAEGIDLLRRMLSFNPRKRITAEEALKHPFFAGILPKPDHIFKFYANVRPIDFEFENTEHTLEQIKRTLPSPIPL